MLSGFCCKLVMVEFDILVVISSGSSDICSWLYFKEILGLGLGLCLVLGLGLCLVLGLI